MQRTFEGLRRWSGPFVIAAVLFLGVLPGDLLAQLPITDDSYTQEAAPTATSGAAGTLIVSGAAVAAENTYIRFGLSPLPKGLTSANVSIATLRLFIDSVTAAGTCDVYLVSSAWNERTVTYGNGPNARRAGRQRRAGDRDHDSTFSASERDCRGTSVVERHCQQRSGVSTKRCQYD
jgi:hypothetical protein